MTLTVRGTLAVKDHKTVRIDGRRLYRNVDGREPTTTAPRTHTLPQERSRVPHDFDAAEDWGLALTGRRPRGDAGNEWFDCVFEDVGNGGQRRPRRQRAGEHGGERHGRSCVPRNGRADAREGTSSGERGGLSAITKMRENSDA